MADRRSNLVILLIVAGLVLVSVGVISGIPGVVKPVKTRLGLDLKGGVELTYKARPTAQANVTTESLEHAEDIMRKRVDQLGVAQPEIQRFGSDEISVALPAVSNAARAQAEVGKTAQLYFYDWEPNVVGPSGKLAGPNEPAVTGGSQAGQAGAGLPEYKAVLRAAERGPILRHNATTWDWRVGCTLEKNKARTGPGAGCVFGQWYLLDTKNEKVLRGPEETEANLYSEGVKTAPGAKLKVVHINPGTILVQASAVEGANGKILEASPESWYVLNDDPALSGSEITNPRQGLDEGTTGQPNVTYEFTSSGKTADERLTKAIAHRGQEAQLPGTPKRGALQHFAAVLDGQIVTAPYIDYTQYPEGIDASTGSEISGFTLTRAQEVADELRSGALPLRLELISQSQVSATLGKTALNQGLIAGLVGFAVVCLFLIAFYRVLGMIAVGGLVIYGVYLFALIKAFHVTLTLPGIAGLILTIGIAADANIVIFERVKEEIRSGRSVIAGIANGYRLGFAAIVDANVVTIMTAFILFALATSGVRGFALTLLIGTLLSLFTAVLATRAALGAMGRSRFVTHPAALGAGRRGRGWTFDFMGASRWFFSLSGVILLTGALAIGGRGLNFGIDFKSGTRIQTAFVKPATESQIREVFTSAGYPNAEIQKLSSKNVGGSGFQISVKQLRPEVVQKLKSDLDAKFATSPTQPGTRNFSSTSIGPTFGKTVAKSAIIAIIASLLVISAYIALRFEWKYAVPVLIALMHDLLITSGVYSLTGREVTLSTVAALLTILGYSLYDTIIVFDRVRENVPRMSRAAFSQIVNRSMSEVLTRSLATSFCTLLPVLALLLFGGETLKDFAFALLVGIASGAYSSIFIASPVLTHWKERESVYRNRRNRILSEVGFVAAYASTAEGSLAASEPRRAGRRALSPEGYEDEQISQEEFDELVRDLDVDEPTTASRGAGARRPAAPPAPERQAKTQPRTPERDPTADLTPEDLVLKDESAGREKPKRGRNRRHGRAR